MAHEVFISYSSRDKSIADATCAALEAAAIRCWIAPRDIAPGAEWGEAIISAIEGSRVFVLIFSSSANASSQVSREIEYAVSKALPIMPLRIERVEPTRSLAYFMAGVHWLDALTPPLERHLQQLATSIKTLLHSNRSAEVPHRTTFGRGSGPAIVGRRQDQQPPDRRSPVGPVIAIVAAVAFALFVLLSLLHHGQYVQRGYRAIGPTFGPSASHRYFYR